MIDIPKKIHIQGFFIPSLKLTIGELAKRCGFVFQRRNEQHKVEIHIQHPASMTHAILPEEDPAVLNKNTILLLQR